MRYQTLIINNFRGIDSLELNDLKKINLIVGRNNCGKTSILEALFLLSGMSNPQLPFIIQQLRDMLITDDDGFSHLFKFCQTGEKIKISGKMDMDLRNLEIEPDYPFPEESTQVDKTIKHSSSSIASISGLRLNFRTGKNDMYSLNFSLKDNKITLAPNYKEKLECHFITPANYWNGIDAKINSLIINKKKDVLIRILKMIDPQIENFEMGGKNIYIDIGQPKLLPINVMGDGIRRIVALIATISSIPNGVLLVDEIETGFHYTTLSILWKAVIAACNEYHVQLIATTHSYECIDALAKSYSEHDPSGDDIRLYRIDKDNTRHKAYMYNSALIEAGIKDTIEVR
jgi:AAA15 family ATPase/GTPase